MSEGQREGMGAPMGGQEFCFKVLENLDINLWQERQSHYKKRQNKQEAVLTVLSCASCLQRFAGTSKNI